MTPKKLSPDEITMLLKALKEIRVKLGDIETGDNEADYYLGEAESSLMIVSSRLRQLADA